MANNHGQRAPTQRETWADWMPHAAASITVSESELLERLNQGGKQSVTSQNLRSWEAQGIIPPPIPADLGSQYPPGAATVIHEAILAPHAQDWDVDRARAVARQMATAHDTTFATSPPRETWWDWFPDASLENALTTEQLLEEVNLYDRASRVTERQLRGWQSAHVLPLPLRRRRDGATRALYPPHAISVIQELVFLQATDVPLREIGPRLRSAATIQLYPDPDELHDAAAALADRHQEVTGRPVDQVEIRFTRPDGTEERFCYVTRGIPMTP